MKVFLILIPCFLVACASAPEKTKKYDNNEGFPFHGEFCGMNVPDTSMGKNANQVIDILNQKSPIDNIDTACQRHDICYAKNGFGNRKCDEKLVKDLYALGTLFNDSSCNVLVGEINAYFNAINLNPTVLYDVSKMGVHTIGTVAVAGLSLILVPIIAIAGGNPFTFIKEMTDSPVFNVHPSRFTKC